MIGKKVVRQKTVMFHNRLLTAVKQHIITCVQNAFLWLWHGIKANSTLLNCLIN